MHYNNFYDKNTNSWQSTTPEVTLHGTDLYSKVADFNSASMKFEEFRDAKRTVDEHCKQEMAWKHAQSQSDRTKIEQNHGV